jgi:hypothetical protein
MSPGADAPRSRRALLAAAAGSAAVLAASAAIPFSAAAHDADDLQLAAVNAAPGTTQLNCTALDVDALVVLAANANSGSGIVAAGAHAPGIRTYSGEQAALFAINGDESGAATAAETITTGVYGYAPTAPDPTKSIGSGVWGDSPDIGVAGSGTWGVNGFGAIGVEGDANNNAGSIGVWAWAPTTAQTALRVTGKVSLSRSGRKSMATGASTLTISLAGVTTSSKVFAVLATSETGRYVRAVVPATGSFKVYLNTTLASSAVVAWFVLD